MLLLIFSATSPPGLEMFVVSVPLIHQLFDFSIHSCLSLLSFPSTQGTGNPSNCQGKTGGEGSWERGNQPKSTCDLWARQFGWARFLDDFGLDNDCVKFCPALLQVSLGERKIIEVCFWTSLSLSWKKLFCCLN